MLLVLIAALILVALGAGYFVVHWLFIVAAILALVWVISLFAGGIGGRRGLR